MHRKVIGIAAAAFLLSTPADAALRLTAGGTITSLRASLDNLTDYPVPDGDFGVGDAWTLSIQFDPAASYENRGTALDPNVGEYYSIGSIITWTAGSYSSTFTTRFRGSVNRNTIGNDIPFDPFVVDSQTFSAFNFDLAGNDSLPFDFGSGDPYFAVTLDMLDLTGSARRTKRIGEIADPGLFSDQVFSFLSSRQDSINGAPAFWNVSGEGSVAYARLVNMAGVPEPATWAMMIAGFGAVGGAMRRTRRPVTRSAMPVAA